MIQILPARRLFVRAGAPCLVALVLIVSPSPASGDQPPADVLAAAQAATAGRHAFVLGIDRFDDGAFADLEWAEADAQAVAGALGTGPWTVDLAADGGSTRDDVLAGLDDFLADLGPADTALVYVSSHGIVDYVDGRPRRFIVTSDTASDELRETSVEVQELLRRVDASLPRWKVVILATCFGGTGEGVRSSADVGSDGRRGPARLTPVDAWPRRATVVLSASYMDGPAWEDPQLGHEIYTYYLLEALSRPFDDDVDLNGDSALSAFEAHGYAASCTVDRTGGRQFPSANLDAVGERDVILLGEPRAAPQRSVFWALLGRTRGADPVQMWVDGEEVRPGTPAKVLAPGKHVLETGATGRREHARRLAFHVRKGQAVQVRDLVARAEDQWIGAGVGLAFLPGAAGYNQDLEPLTDDPSYTLPGVSPVLRIGFEQRLWPRHRLGATAAVTAAWQPGAGYDGDLSLPARYAAADLALLLEQRATWVSPAVGPVVSAVYLRSTGREGAMAAAAGGAVVRIRIRLGGRLALRLGAQLLATRAAPLALPTQFLLLPSFTVDLGVEL